MVMLEKIADRGFLAFWLFENEWKFRKSVKLTQKIWNLAKSEYYPLRHHGAAPLYSSCTACHSISNISTTTGTSATKPWNVRMYHYHTSYYTDHRFPIINTNRFVIYPLWILSLSKLNSSVHLFHDQTWNGTMFTNHNQLIMPQTKLQKIARVQFWFSVVWKNTPQFSLESAQ